MDAVACIVGGERVEQRSRAFPMEVCIETRAGEQIVGVVLCGICCERYVCMYTQEARKFWNTHAKVEFFFSN